MWTPLSRRVAGWPAGGRPVAARSAPAAGVRVLQPRASLPEADLDFGIVDQLLRPAGRQRHGPV